MSKKSQIQPGSGLNRLLKPTAEELNRLDKLQAGVDAAAQSARINYLFFLTILGYFLILVQRTTHEDMFKQSDLLLPGLGIGVGIVEFYFAAPIFIGLLHINVLIHYYLLAKRAFAYETELAKLPDEDWRRNLTYPFLLSDLLLGRHLPRAVRALIALFLFITVMVIPGLTLLYAQAQFVPFHSVGVTTANQWTVVIDGIAEFFLYGYYLYYGRNIEYSKIFKYTENTLFLLSMPIIAMLLILASEITVPKNVPVCKNNQFIDCVGNNDQPFFPRALNLSGKTLVAKEPPPN
jgi:hypothetical protein